VRGGASALFVVSWLAHGAELVRRGIESGAWPVTNLSEYLLGLAWAILGLHLVLWFGWRIYVASLVLPPLAALAAIAALPWLHEGGAAPVRERGPWFLFHTTVSTLGMATLSVAFAMSLIYLVQDRALKAKRTLSLLERMPSLERCDRIGFGALLVGFALLTLGIATGVVVNASFHERLWVAGPKQVLPLVAWIVFAGLLLARFKLGFRGRRSAWLTITGVTIGLLTAVGMTL
jgi:ABC-type uncharacterized transport system permease subunit